MIIEAKRRQTRSAGAQPALSPRRWGQLEILDGNTKVRLITGLLCAGLVWVGHPSASANLAKPEGTWIIGNRVAIAVFDCSNAGCGRIVWLRNPALRTGEMCGRTIVWGLVSDGPARWSNGWFFDPENRSTYNLSAELQSPDVITARIYKGVSLFGRTEILNRIRPRSLEGWC